MLTHFLFLVNFLETMCFILIQGYSRFRTSFDTANNYSIFWYSLHLNSVYSQQTELYLLALNASDRIMDLKALVLLTDVISLI